jgi:hypothetical protein
MDESVKQIICQGILVTVVAYSVSPVVCDKCGHEHMSHVFERSPMARTQSTTDVISTFTTSASGMTITTTTLPPPIIYK